MRHRLEGLHVRRCGGKRSGRFHIAVGGGRVSAHQSAHKQRLPQPRSLCTTPSDASVACLPFRSPHQPTAAARSPAVDPAAGSATATSRAPFGARALALPAIFSVRALRHDQLHGRWTALSRDAFVKSP